MNARGQEVYTDFLSLEPLKQTGNSTACNGRFGLCEKQRIMPHCCRAAGYVFYEVLTRAQAQRNNALLVAFAVDNGVSLGQMHITQAQTNYLTFAQSAIQHKRTNTVVPQVNIFFYVERLKHGGNLRRGQHINGLALCLGQGKPCGQIRLYVFLGIEPRKKRFYPFHVGLYAIVCYAALA